MNNKIKYTCPTIQVFKIFTENNLAASSSYITINGADGMEPLVENWEDAAGQHKNLDF